jgi:restriction system protein
LFQILGVDVTIPDYQTLMLPVLKLASDGEVRIRDVIDKVSKQLGLADDERNKLLDSGRQTVIDNRTRWAKTYMERAGLLEATGRGRFIITDRGRKVLNDNPTRIDNNFLLQFPEFREYRRVAVAADHDASGSDEEQAQQVSGLTSTPDETMRQAAMAIEQTIAKDLLDRLTKGSPTFFEKAVISLLQAIGYGGSRKDAARAIGRVGDGGVDGVIEQDAFGLERVYVQSKRYAQNVAVSAPEIQKFVGSLNSKKANKGVFVTTSYFTDPAITESEKTTYNIILINGKRLTELMIRHNVGVRNEETLYIKKIDEDFFPEE